MDAPLVARHAELAVLGERLEQSTRGAARPVLIEGDAGTGKTRLVQELGVQADRAGMRFLYGRAHELVRSVPFGALNLVLERPLSTLHADERAALVGDHGDQLGLLLPTVFPLPTAEVDRFQAYLVLARLLRTWSESTPLVLGFDDVHWADEGTLEALEVVVPRLAESRCLVVAAYRGRPPDLTPAARAALERLAAGEVDVMRIGDLDDEDAGELVAALIGENGSAEIVQSVVRVTRGNPFLLTEAVRAAVEYGVAIDPDAPRPELQALPWTARARPFVFHRVFACGADAVAVARAVSALGSLRLGSPAHAALPAVTGLTEDAIDHALDQLVGAGVLEGDAVLEFAHPIVRSIVYEDLGLAARRRLHRAVAEQLEEAARRGAPVTPAEVASHVVNSAVEGDEQAVRTLVAAGDDSVPLSPTVAARWYQDALRLLPEGAPARARVQARRARALLLADALGEAVEAARAALLTVTGDRDRVSAFGTLVSSLALRGHLDEALEEVEIALAEMPEGQGRARLLTHKTSALLYKGRLSEARVFGEEALRQVGDDSAARIHVLRNLSHIAFALGDFDESEQLHDEALRLAEGMPGARIVTLAASGRRRLSIGELAAAEADLTEAARLCEAAGTLAYEPDIRSGLAASAWLRGDWDDALAYGAAALREAERSERMSSVIGTWTPLIAIAVDRGQLAEARARIAEVVTSRTATGNRLNREYVQWCTGHLARTAGRIEECIERLEAARVDADEGFAAGLLFVDTELVEAYTEAGRVDEAVAVVADLERLVSRCPTAFTGAVLDRARLVATGDVDAGRAAHAAFAALGAGFEAAKAALLLGSATEDADLVRQAYRAFEHLGADPWQRRARRVLRNQGQPMPRRPRATRSAGLSDLEQQMVELLATGLSNREIARSLLLSQKTVESYLSRVYTKTGCRSRVELATAYLSGRLEGPSAG